MPTTMVFTIVSAVEFVDTWTVWLGCYIIVSWQKKSNYQCKRVHWQTYQKVGCVKEQRVNVFEFSYWIFFTP